VLVIHIATHLLAWAIWLGLPVLVDTAGGGEGVIGCADAEEPTQLTKNKMAPKFVAKTYSFITWILGLSVIKFLINGMLIASRGY
jgi:hypothetical protein